MKCRGSVNGGVHDLVFGRRRSIELSDNAAKAGDQDAVGNGDHKDAVMREHLRQHGVGYLVAVGATATVGLVRFLLSGLLGDASPFLPFVLAVLLSAWHGGLKPGLLATALGAGIAVFLFTEPHYSFRITNDGEEDQQPG